MSDTVRHATIGDMLFAQPLFYIRSNYPNPADVMAGDRSVSAT